MNTRILGFPAEVLDRLGRFHGFSAEVDRYLPIIFQHLGARERGPAENDPSFKQLIPYVVFASGGQRGGVEAGVPATRSLRGGAQVGVPATRSLRGGVEVFRYVRGKRGGEARLHELHSIGVGGHIEVTDVSLFENGRGAGGLPRRAGGPARANQANTDAGEAARDPAGLTLPIEYELGLRREIAEEVELPEGAGQQRVVGLINDDSTPVGQVHFGVVHLWELPAPELRRRDAALARASFASLDNLLAERDKFETWSQFVLDWLAAQEGI